MLETGSNDDVTAIVMTEQAQIRLHVFHTHIHSYIATCTYIAGQPDSATLCTRVSESNFGSLFVGIEIHTIHSLNEAWNATRFRNVCCTKCSMKYTCIVSIAVPLSVIVARVRFNLVAGYLCVCYGFCFSLRFEFVYISIILSSHSTWMSHMSRAKRPMQRGRRWHIRHQFHRIPNIYYSCGIAHCMQLIFKNCSFSRFVRLLPLLKMSIQSHTCRIN